MRRSAFTLIELLVVIAIIALLVSILAPSLNRAKDIARVTVCATNEHHIANAIHFYVIDNNDWFPYTYGAGSPNPAIGEAGFTIWWRRVGKMRNGADEIERDGYLDLDNHKFSGETWHCPMVFQAPKNHWTDAYGGWAADRFSVHYSMNSYLCPSRSSDGSFSAYRPCRRLEDVRPDTALLGDGRLLGPWGGNQLHYFVSGINHRYWESYPWPVDSQTGRIWAHLERVNVAFVDTHVEPVADRWDEDDLEYHFLPME